LPPADAKTGCVQCPMVSGACSPQVPLPAGGGGGSELPPLGPHESSAQSRSVQPFLHGSRLWSLQQTHCARALTHTHTHAHTHARTHARTHAHTHTHTQTTPRHVVCSNSPHVCNVCRLKLHTINVDKISHNCTSLISLPKHRLRSSVDSLTRCLS